MATELTCLMPAPGSERVRTIAGTAAVPGREGLLVPGLEESLDRPVAGLDERAVAPRPEVRLEPRSLALAKANAAMTPPAVTMATAPRTSRPERPRPLPAVGSIGLTGAPPYCPGLAAGAAPVGVPACPA